jgi:hypothetical protein
VLALGYLFVAASDLRLIAALPDQTKSVMLMIAIGVFAILGARVVAIATASARSALTVGPRVAGVSAAILWVLLTPATIFAITTPCCLLLMAVRGGA